MKFRTCTLAICLTLAAVAPASAASSAIGDLKVRDIGQHILYKFTFCTQHAGHATFEAETHTNRGFAPTFTATGGGYQPRGCRGWMMRVDDTFASGVWQGWVNAYIHGQKIRSRSYYFNVH
jgi:hypothetical protein